MECQLENITVYYESFGEGRPILILPGWGIGLDIMTHDLEPIFQTRQGWRRIYVDPPGHGGTPGKEWITSQDGILQVILDFIDHVIPGQRLVVAGLSLGAYLARGVIYHRPQQVDGLFMSVPVILAEDDRRTVPEHVVLEEDPAVVAELEPDEAELFGIAVVCDRKLLDRMRSYPVPVGGAAGDAEFLEQIRMDPARYGCSFDVDDLPEPFPGPTLIIAGRQDSVVGYRDAWGLLENYPRATFAVLDRAGHLLEGKGRLVHALVDDWLDRLEADGGST